MGHTKVCWQSTPCLSNDGLSFDWGKSWNTGPRNAVTQLHVFENSDILQAYQGPPAPSPHSIHLNHSHSPTHLPRCLPKPSRFGWLWITREAKFKAIGLHRECLVNNFLITYTLTGKLPLSSCGSLAKNNQKPVCFKILYLRTLNLTENITTKIIWCGKYVPVWEKLLDLKIQFDIFQKLYKNQHKKMLLLFVQLTRVGFTSCGWLC